jgi:hypothetical protein
MWPNKPGARRARRYFQILVRQNKVRATRLMTRFSVRRDCSEDLGTGGH